FFVALLWCLTAFFFSRILSSVLYTLSLHDALPICSLLITFPGILQHPLFGFVFQALEHVVKLIFSLFHYIISYVAIISMRHIVPDRKSTRLNSSHVSISYAVFCLKKKNNKNNKTE